MALKEYAHLDLAASGKSELVTVAQSSTQRNSSTKATFKHQNDFYQG